jgi:hypothetical protein
MMQRRQFLKTLAGGATTAGVMGSSGLALASDDVTTEITALLRKTEDIWNAQETAGLLGLWDRDNAMPIYLAGEQEDFFVGWDQLKRYLDPKGGPDITEAIRVLFSDIKVHSIGPDLAFAAYWMRTDMKLIFAPNPFGSDNRVTSVLRKTSDGWKYLAYAEAFQAPTMYFQKLFEKDVSPDYQEFFDQIKQQKRR